MPTRKKGLARNATTEHINPPNSRKSSRSTQAAAAEHKVNDLITSSSKKQIGGGLLKKNRALRGGKKLNSIYDSAGTGNDVAGVPSSSFFNHKVKFFLLKVNFLAGQVLSICVIIHFNIRCVSIKAKKEKRGKQYCF
jgi:hypothetical protein